MGEEAEDDQNKNLRISLDFVLFLSGAHILYIILYIRACLSLSVSVCVSLCVSVSLSVSLSLCLCLSVCLSHICVCVCVCTHARACMHAGLRVCIYMLLMLLSTCFSYNCNCLNTFFIFLNSSEQLHVTLMVCFKASFLLMTIKY